MTFEDLQIIDPILKALDDQGYTEPTPIQQRTIPILLKGDDLLGCAQTGTGKTAAFAIPIIQYLFLNRQKVAGKRRIRALILTPTRELAIQIADSFTTYGKYTGLKNTVVFGGVKQAAQTDMLRQGVDVLVATPGRLLDLMNQGFVHLQDVKFSVLDEADRMLDMGFIHDIQKIIAKLPTNRQSLFFSATLPPAIISLSQKLLGNPVKVTIKPEQPTAERVEQSVYFVNKRKKSALLVHLLLSLPFGTTLVFSRTKHGADKIVKLLNKANINAEAIHGNKSQPARQKALGNFKSGKTSVLIATDIAARGIDVEKLGLVLNYDLPDIPETYVHRIGRTGRASESGVAISFCDPEERQWLKDIQRLIRQTIPVVEDHPFLNTPVENDALDNSPDEKTKSTVSKVKKNQYKPRPYGSKKSNPSGQKSGQSNSKKPKSGEQNSFAKKSSQSTSRKPKSGEQSSFAKKPSQSTSRKSKSGEQGSSGQKSSQYNSKPSRFAGQKSTGQDSAGQKSGQAKSRPSRYGEQSSARQKSTAQKSGQQTSKTSRLGANETQSTKPTGGPGSYRHYKNKNAAKKQR